jgi:hypothetical protein
MVVIHPLDAGIHKLSVTITANVPKIRATPLRDVSFLQLYASTKTLVNVLTVTPPRDVFTTILFATITMIVPRTLVTLTQMMVMILVSTLMLPAMITLYVLKMFVTLTTVVVNSFLSVATPLMNVIPQHVLLRMDACKLI